MAAITLDGPWSGSAFVPAQPTDITTIEMAIVTRLASQITSVEVAHFPDTPQAYRLTHRIGAALVRYEGADYGALKDTGSIVQERTLKFAVSVLVRDVGWSFGGEPGGTSPGGYALLESVRGALSGFRIAGFGKIYPVSERFLERDKQGGVWIYAITFAVKTLAVEPSSADNYPVFVLGVAQEQGGITTVSLAPAPYSFGENGEIALPNGNVTFVEVLSFPAGTPYNAGTDYTVNAVAGVISLISGGAIEPGAAVSIGYSYAETVIATPSEVGDPSTNGS
jgi:Gp37 protein